MDKYPTSSPPGFSDAQIDQLLLTLRPLNEAQREALLEDLASTLRQAPHLGDGMLFRTLRILQRKYFVPPTVDGVGAPLKWER